MVGPNLHAIIAMGVMYMYRNTKHIPILLIMSGTWFISIIALVIFTHSNEGIFNNYLIAAIIYIIVTVVIIFRKAWNQF